MAIADRFWRHVDRCGPTMPHMDTPCWVWTGAHRAGYGALGNDYAHRLSLELHVGPAPFPDARALHACDNPPCVNPAHLRWGTQAENIADMHARGRASVPTRGELSARAKLTEPDVREILSSSDPPGRLALRFGVSRRCVRNIRDGSRWAHVGGVP